MKKQLLTILALGIGLFVQAQTVSTLPTTTVPYGTQTRIQRSTGDIYVGSAALKFRALAQKKYTDSLLALKQNVLGFTPYNATNPAGYITSASLSGYVPTTRTLTINGTTLDLSTDRSFTVAANTDPLEFNTTDRTVWNNGKGNKNHNLSYGEGALRSITSGDFNTAIGYNTLYGNTTGLFNTAIGYTTLDANIGGFHNTAIGHSVLGNITSSGNNTAIGSSALGNSTHSSENTAIGFSSMGSSNSSSQNVAVGAHSLSANNGNGNVAIGYKAGESNSTGFSNTMIGYSALGSNTSGKWNIAIGNLSGGYASNNDKSIYIGYNVSPNLNTNQTNQIVIGDSVIGAGSNTATLGNTSITLTRLRGQVNMGSIKLDAMNTAPASATATGTVGEIRVTDTHIYVCTATNTWVRTALATW